MDARLSGVSAVSRRDASRHTMDRIRRVLIQCLGLNVDEADLDYERRLDESVGLDSVAALEFIAALEKEFCIKIESDMLELDKLRRLPQLAFMSRPAWPSCRVAGQRRRPVERRERQADF